MRSDPSDTPRPFPRRRAMTLVELLAAALVLNTLVILLLVFAARAKEEERQTICRSNLRQIGLGLAMYSSDNNGYTPSWPGLHTEFHGWTLSDTGPDGEAVPQGLGLLWPGGYYHSSGIVCPGVSSRDFEQPTGPYRSLFQRDSDDLTLLNLRRRRLPSTRLSDGDGIMDLGGRWNVPRGQDVIVSTYWLRPSERLFLTLNANQRESPPLVSDTILGWTPLSGVSAAPGEPTFISNHDGVWNVLFTDGTVKTYHDADAALKRRLAEISQAKRPDDRSGVGRSELIFEKFFKPLHD